MMMISVVVFMLRRLLQRLRAVHSYSAHLRARPFKTSRSRIDRMAWPFLMSTDEGNLR